MERIPLSFYGLSEECQRGAMEWIEPLLSMQSLADVLHWGMLQTPPFHFVDMVHQDEYRQDVLMRLPGGWYLVIDVT